MKALTAGWRRYVVPRSRPAVGRDRLRLADEVLERGRGRALGMRALRDLRQLVRVAEQDDRRAPRPRRRTPWPATAARPRRRTGRRARPRASSRAHSHDVPPTTSHDPARRPGATASGFGMRSMPNVSPAVVLAVDPLPDPHEAGPRPRPRAGSTSSRFAMTRCDWAVTPTRLPASTRSRIIRAAVCVLPVPGGPWIASTVSSSRSARVARDRRHVGAVRGERVARRRRRRSGAAGAGAGRAPPGTGPVPRARARRRDRRAAPARRASAPSANGFVGISATGMGVARVALEADRAVDGVERDDRRPRRVPARAVGRSGRARCTPCPRRPSSPARGRTGSGGARTCSIRPRSASKRSSASADPSATRSSIGASTSRKWSHHWRLRLAPVPVEQRREQPAALLVGRALEPVLGHAVAQRVLACPRLGLGLGDLRRRCPVLPARAGGPRRRVPLGVRLERLVAPALEPVAEQEVGDAVVAVVGRDRVEDRRVLLGPSSARTRRPRSRPAVIPPSRWGM